MPRFPARALNQFMLHYVTAHHAALHFRRAFNQEGDNSAEDGHRHDVDLGTNTAKNPMFTQVSTDHNVMAPVRRQNAAHDFASE